MPKEVCWCDSCDQNEAVYAVVIADLEGTVIDESFLCEECARAGVYDLRLTLGDRNDSSTQQ